MTQHLFRCQDAALVRIPANPDSSAPAPPEPAGDTAVPVDEWRQWLRQAWDDETAEAIELASPSLAAAVRQACAEELQPGRLTAVSMSVLRYLLRMRSRATPFGTFAGIAPVRLGSRAAVLQAGSRRTSSRPDPVWLADVITALQAHPGVFRQLTVTANNLCFERAGRMIIACRPGTGGAPPSEISIRSTTAVRQVMHAAQESPVAVGDLADMIAARHPDTSPQTIERMLGELVTCGALLTNLCAPVTVTDPLGHLIDQLGQLTAAGPGRDTLTSLRTIRHQLACHDQASGPGERRRLRKQATCSMRELSARSDQPITTDLLLGTQVRLPPGVLREAEAAASALARLSPYRSGRPSWQEYHARFLDRYGEGAIIPVAQLVNPATGLGYPAGYRGSAAPHPVRPVTSRDRALMRMAQQAAMEDRLEIELDDATMGELAAETAMRTVPHTELRFSLHARTTAALDRGEFTLVVGGASRNGGTTVGRFLHLLDQPDRDRVVQTLNDMAPALPGAALAQLSSPPLRQDSTDLARTPPVFPVLSLGEHQPPRPGQIPLTDLAVSGDAKRLFLVRLSRGQIVEPVLLNAVEDSRNTHPLARFLAEITTGRDTACVPFDWGAASSLPFLPRLRYRRCVLSSARWQVSAVGLPGPAASITVWTAAWRARQRRYRIPGSVYLGEHDVRIKLDLASQTHLDLLRSRLSTAGIAGLTEAPPPATTDGSLAARTRSSSRRPPPGQAAAVRQHGLRGRCGPPVP